MSILERIRNFFSAGKQNKKINDDTNYVDSYPTHNIIYENDSSHISHYENHISTHITHDSTGSGSSELINDSLVDSTGNDFSNDGSLDTGSSDF